MGIQGVPIAPEAGFGGKYLPGGPPAMPGMPLGGPPPEVLVSPEHMAAYAANCRRTLHYAVNGTLLAKRDHIQHQIGRLRARMLEVAHVKGVMEREIQSEASEAHANDATVRASATSSSCAGGRAVRGFGHPEEPIAANVDEGGVREE